MYRDYSEYRDAMYKDYLEYQYDGVYRDAMYGVYRDFMYGDAMYLYELSVLDSLEEWASTRGGRSGLSRLIDVYIKNRDPLVKQTLTTQLYNTLHLLELIDVYIKYGLGISFPSIKIAIHSAKVHLAIFSNRSRCFADVDLSKMPELAELVRMLESNCKSIPVFYHEELQKLRQRNCQMSKNPVGQGLHDQVKEFKRGRFGQLVQTLEKQCTLQGKKRRKP